MESTESPSPKIPISVTVESDSEPIACDGFYLQRGSGFVLEFALNNDLFVIESDNGAVRVTSSGVLSYSIDFSRPSRIEIVLNEYKVTADVTPVKTIVDCAENGVNLDLEYLLSDAARSIKIVARFKNIEVAEV